MSSIECYYCNDLSYHFHRDLGYDGNYIYAMCKYCFEKGHQVDCNSECKSISQEEYEVSIILQE